MSHPSSPGANLHGPTLAEESVPTRALRPYPEHYATSSTLADGTPILIRSIRPEDEPMMVKFHETLSEQSVHNRYFAALSLAHRTGHARLARLCFIDYDREIALVAVHDDPVSGCAEILGVGRLIKAREKNEAEFALVVSDRWQKRGLGTQLLKRLIEIGREEHLARITGTVLAENSHMRRLCEHAGFSMRHRSGEPELEATLDYETSASLRDALENSAKDARFLAKTAALPGAERGMGETQKLR